MVQESATSLFSQPNGTLVRRRCVFQSRICLLRRDIGTAERSLGQFVITKHKMCWSSAASLIFGLTHLITAFYVYQHRLILVDRGRSYILFLLFYALMEFFQAAQWNWGDLLSPSTYGHDSCSSNNQLFTIGAYFLIWSQPLLYSIIARSSKRLIAFSVITLLWGLLSLLIGLVHVPTYRVPNSNYGRSTCSEVGPHGHIGWKFAPQSVKYSPNDFLYIVLIVVILWKRNNLLLFGWLSSMVCAMTIVGTGIDLPAYWCFLSATVDLPIVCDVWYRMRRRSDY